MRRILRPRVIIPLGLVLAIVFAGSLYLFQPWKLFTTTEVYEALPSTSADVTPGIGASSDSVPVPSSAPTGTPSADVAPRVLATGSFISHEHQTSGTAKILELLDGTRVLRLENLNTSDGPMLEVWLAVAPVIDGRDGWGVFDDGNHLSLGSLKGNVGNQNYVIPDGIDPTDFTAVSIWCARFHVSFGAAELNPVG